MMDFEDCMQMAGEVFARCSNRYSGTVDNPAWFMSLFQKALANEFHYYAVECGLRREAEKQHIEEIQQNHTEVEIESASLSTITMDASSELKQVLTTIANAPREFLEILLKESDDSGWSRRLCRLCGTKKLNEGIVAELRSLLNTHSGEGRVYLQQTQATGDFT
jgi:hypothetical protein